MASPKPMNYGYGSSPLPSQYSAKSGSSSSSGSRGLISPPSSVGMGMTNGSRPLMVPAQGLPGGGQHVPSAHYTTAPPQTQQPRHAYPASQKKGTLNPGQEVKVGAQTVIVDRYLSEGEHATSLFPPDAPHRTFDRGCFQVAMHTSTLPILAIRSVLTTSPPTVSNELDSGKNKLPTC